MTKVLVLSHDAVGRHMAGPAIRYLQIATHLSADHEVVLAAPNPVDEGLGVHVAGYDHLDQTLSLMRRADVCIAQYVTPRLAMAARRAGTRLLMDLYDPFVLEVLETTAFLPQPHRQAQRQRAQAILRLALQTADGVLCANERQRDLWIGALMATGRLTNGLDAERRVVIVPFGMPDEEPARSGPGLREAFGLDADHMVLLWGGGLWNWLDPMTPVRAMAELSRVRDDLRLVFMGVVRPYRGDLESQTANQTLRLAEELGVAGRQVLFNTSWIAYDKRQDFLLDADAGVSAHPVHLETRFAFRTRVLDYLWARLPMVLTRGDQFGDESEAAGWGPSVPPGDVTAMAQAFVQIGDEEYRMRARAHVAESRGRFVWSTALAPLGPLVSELVETDLTGGPALAASSEWYLTGLRQARVQGRLTHAVLRRLPWH